MSNSWITQCWLGCAQISCLGQVCSFSLAPWLKSSNLFALVSRLCLWVMLECLSVWFILRCIWYQTVPLASLYESFCALTIFICSLNILASTQSHKGSRQWLPVGINVLLVGILLFVDFALPLSMQQSDGPPQSLRAPWLLIHVSMMIISYALLTLGSLAVLGGIYALQYAASSKFFPKYSR